MLQHLMSLVRESAGDIISNNPDLPAEKKEEAVQVAGSSVIGGMQDMLKRGNVKDVLQLFSGKSGDIDNSPVTQHVSQSMIDNLTGKLGISSSQAGSIASSLAPMILGKLVNRTNDPGDNNFNIQDIFNQLSGGKTSGMNIGGLLSKFSSGLDQDGDGDVDLQDLAGMFTGGSGGGLMDKVKGLFK